MPPTGGGSRRSSPRASPPRGGAIASDGVYAFLVGLAPQLRVDPGGSSFGLDVPHDHHVELDSEHPLLLVPSVYVWPHVRINCLVYRAPPRGEPPPCDAARARMRLPGARDPTRLRILQHVVRRPRSTQELAPLVGLSEARTSKHLRLLAVAGILETRREGYYVVYSLVDEQLETLTTDLCHAIASPAVE